MAAWGDTLIQVLQKTKFAKAGLIDQDYFRRNVYERKWERTHRELGELSGWAAGLPPNERARKGRLGGSISIAMQSKECSARPVSGSSSQS